MVKGVNVFVICERSFHGKRWAVGSEVQDAVTGTGRGMATRDEYLMLDKDRYLRTPENHPGTDI